MNPESTWLVAPSACSTKRQDLRASLVSGPRQEMTTKTESKGGVNGSSSKTNHTPQYVQTQSSEVRSHTYFPLNLNPLESPSSPVTVLSKTL